MTNRTFPLFTIMMTSLWLNMRPVTKCVCVFATSGTAIVDSSVTFTGVRTATEVNVSGHVGLDTFRCTGQIVGSWPPAWKKKKFEIYS